MPSASASAAAATKKKRGRPTKQPPPPQQQRAKPAKQAASASSSKGKPKAAGVRRRGPDVSAGSMQVGARMVGNDGAMWKVVAVAAGTKRWVRERAAAAAPVSTSSQQLHIRLPVVLDDLLGRRAEAASGAQQQQQQLGMSYPCAVPADARTLLRRRILRNEFEFQHLLPGGDVPVVWQQQEQRASFWSALLGKKKGGRRVAARLSRLKLVESPGGCWGVDTTWDLAEPDDGGGYVVDIGALREELHGSISDGWGEGVEQLRFGPWVSCDYEMRPGSCRATTKKPAAAAAAVDATTTQRYAFNLTLVPPRPGLDFPTGRSSAASADPEGAWVVLIEQSSSSSSWSSKASSSNTSSYSYYTSVPGYTSECVRRLSSSAPLSSS